MRILRNNVQCSVVRPAIYDDVLQRLHIACLTRDALDAVAYRVSHVQHRRYDGEGYQLRLLISGLTIFSLVAKTAPQRSRETTPGKPRPFGFRPSPAALSRPHCATGTRAGSVSPGDRKSTRLNSCHSCHSR